MPRFALINEQRGRIYVPSFVMILAVAICISSSCTNRSKSHPITADDAFDHLWDTFQSGNLVQAQAEAETDYEQFRSLSAEWAWRFNILRARVLYRRGMYNDSLKVLASESAPLPEGDLTVKNLWLHGLIDTSLRRFAAAGQELAQAEQICRGTNYPSCGMIPTALGSMEMQRGRFASAQPFFERALAISRASNDQAWQASALLDLSWSTEQQAHFDEAIDWATAARQIVPQQLGSVAQTALGNIGWAYYRLGEADRARETFIEARDEAIKLGDLADEARWLDDLGYVYMDDNDPNEAQKYFHESLDLARKINSREDIVNAVQALAFVNEQTSKIEDAKRYTDDALRMANEDGNKVDQMFIRLVQGRIAAREHDAVAAQSALEEVVDSKDSPVFLKWEAQRSLARLYEDEHQNEGASREYRAALSTFEAARSELKHENTRLPFLTNATHIYDDYIHFLVSRGKTDEALQVAEFSRARTLSEGLGFLKVKSSTEYRVPSTEKTPNRLGTRDSVHGTAFQPEPLNAAQIARRAGGSIFFYWLGEKQSYLWLVTAQKTTLFPLPPASEIDAVVRRYRKALQGPLNLLETSNSDGIALYRTLVAPAKALLPKKNARVFIIPDGSLNTVNFETLIVPDPAPHYWIEDVTLADANSLRLLAASRPAAAHALPLLIMGNAVAPSADYPELQKASVEMDSIGRHFTPAQQKVFTREQATPAAYLSSKPEQFSYIHFVAHGTASRTNPLDSAIVLSRATKEDDSFKLYARDIIHHNLRADLVTISTCYGAGFRAYSGEGLVGLSWAFLRAGAHNVIGALWEVSDASTPQLMDQLYSNLKNGQKPDAALRTAKLSLLHSNNAFRKPFYWAPFQLYTGS
jgi:CHAT domain-containing protein